MSTVPQKVRHHSGLFCASTATRSPLRDADAGEQRVADGVRRCDELGEVDPAVAVDDELLVAVRGPELGDHPQAGEAVLEHLHVDAVDDLA